MRFFRKIQPTLLLRRMLGVPIAFRCSVFVGTAISTCAQAVAQFPGEAGGKKDAWVVSYAVVILCIGLGVFIIAKPARREK